jgi:uncharacterized protein YbaR (Trm112 family)
MSKLELETEMKLYKHFVLVCPKCKHNFLPWHTLSITTEQTGWKDALYCPNCGNLLAKDTYEKLI